MIILLGFAGLTAGVVTSAGLVALLSAIGLLPRIAGATGTAGQLRWYESVIAVGCGAGNLVQLYGMPWYPGLWLLVPYGICGGIFTGALVMALAETANVLPIFERRIHLRKGLPVLVAFYAFGKLAGSFVYFTKILE